MDDFFEVEIMVIFKEQFKKCDCLNVFNCLVEYFEFKLGLDKFLNK